MSGSDVFSGTTPARRIGFFTTDRQLVIRSWDPALATMTGLVADTVKGRRLDDVAPDLRARGIADLILEPLVSGATQVLAPALHHYLIRCRPLEPSPEFEVMQQRIVVTPLRDDAGTVGLAFSIEDVTSRLAAERQLARELRNPDPVARHAAVDRLSALPPVSGLGPFSVALSDADWQVRRAAVAATAANQAAADLVQALVGALREAHHDFNLLSSAIKLLTMTGIDATGSLVELLRDDDANVRIQAALALGAQRRPEALDALLGVLTDPDVNVRFHAIEALGKLRMPAAVEPLVAIAESRDFFLAFPAIDALVRIGDPVAAPRIVSLLDDRLLAPAAAEALGELGDEDAIPALVSALDNPEPPVGAIVDALVAIHAQYEQTAGAAECIEDLVAHSIRPSGSRRILDEVALASGTHLRNVVTVLSWVRGEPIERALADLLGNGGVHHEAIEALVRFGSPMVDLLIEQVHSDDLAARRSAVTALGRIGDRRAVPALARLIESDDRDLLIPAAAALARIGDPRAFEPLFGLLGDCDAAVRRAAIGALNSIGHPDMPGRIASLLDSPNRDLRESAVRIAGYFGYPTCADRLFTRATQDGDEAVRAAAIEHLPYVDDPRVTAVVCAAAVHGTPRVRAAAAHALASIDPPAGSDVLHAALADPEAWVRYFAVMSIGRRRDGDAFGELATRATADPARQVRVAAIEAIGAIGGDAAVEILSTMAGSTDGDLATSALRSLGSIPGDAAIAVLTDALRSRDARRRTVAAEALGSSPTPATVDALRWTALADADPIVVRAAVAGLAAIAARSTALAGAAVDSLVTVALDAERSPEATAALMRLPSSTIPAVGAVLSRPEPRARTLAVDLLGRIARPAASTHVVRALDDTDPSVRQRAVTALARLGSRGVGRRLMAIAHGDQSAAVRRAAERALARAGHAEGRRL